MTQELTDIRTCILSGRYDEALMLVDELEGMSNQFKIKIPKLEKSHGPP